MARGRFGGALPLLTGIGAGFLAAALWLDAPPPDAAPEPRQRAPSLQPKAAPASDRLPAAARPERRDGGPTTLAGILQLDGDFEQTAALYELVRTTDPDELQRLITEADALANTLDRRAALSILYARWADLDPQGALAFLQHAGGGHATAAVPALFHGWARRDLDAAVAAASELPEALRRLAGVSIIGAREDLARDARRDVARRLAIQHVLSELEMQRLLEQADRDPAAAWQTVLAERDGMMRQQLLGGVVQRWAQQDPHAALTAVASLGNPSLRQMLEQQIVHRWAEHEPQQALDWVMSQPPSPRQGQLAALTLGRLARNDPRSAFALAQSLPGRSQSNALQQVLLQWAQQDPAAAAEGVEQIDGRAVRRHVLFPVAMVYARQDPEGALAWAQRLEPEEGGSAVSMVFDVLAERDPLEAAARIAALSDETLQAHAVSAVASSWAQRDPAAAARWAENLPDDTLRLAAVGNVMHLWASYDRAAALRHAESLALPAEREAALMAMLQAEAGDAEFAARVFERLSDPAQRATAARLLYFSLREVDPEQAERYRELAGSAEPGWAPAPSSGTAIGIRR